MLTFLGPPDAVFLLARPRFGVMLTKAMSTGDVALNAWGGVMHGFQLDALVAQSLFLVFDLANVRLWPRQRSPGLFGAARGP